jgi:hypothetical protein
MNNLLKKIAIFLCCISLMQISIHAQNEIDALRFSEIDWQGSARFMGAGKAFGAVGAEFSALNINPAAIGLYKKSEVTFTPMTLSIYKNNSDYNGSATPAQAIKYNLGSAGIVIALPGISSTLWKKFQVGFGFNRIKNYNNAFSIEGRNFGSTIGSVFASAANGLNYKDILDKDIWSSELFAAWESVLIDTLPGTETSYFPVAEGMNMHHTSTVTRSGGNDEMIFPAGANYGDKLFLGATIGVPFINFTENRTFKEENDKDQNYVFRSYTMTDKLHVRSTGINLKLGIIYQPVDFLRVGLAFHTPTYYGNVKDYFERRIDFANKFYDDSESYSNSFNYTLTTPLRATANVAFFLAQRAFISMEYEFANYGSASMYSKSYPFRDENRAVQEMYGFSHIARIGAEVNLSQVFALRAGYNYISSPYKDKINDGSQHYASAGFGFRTKYIFGDFAYAFNISKEKYWMYDPAFVHATHNKFITHRAMLTLGVRF